MFAYLVYNTYSFFIVNRKGLNSLKSWLILNFQLMRWTVLIAQACLSKNFQFCVYRWGAKTELWTWWGGIHPLPPCGRGALPLLTQDGEGYKRQVLGWQQAQPRLNYCVAYAKTIRCIFSSWILLGKKFLRRHLASLMLWWSQKPGKKRDIEFYRRVNQGWGAVRFVSLKWI